jgi:hypothetical protein
MLPNVLKRPVEQTPRPDRDDLHEPQCQLDGGHRQLDHADDEQPGARAAEGDVSAKAAERAQPEHPRPSRTDVGPHFAPPRQPEPEAQSRPNGVTQRPST